MQQRVNDCVAQEKKMKNRSLFTLLLSTSTIAFASNASAQTSPSDEIIVTGIRASLENALVEKRNADSLVEVILAEDIGKLPDQNLAEVLENVTGIQITRTAGVGTGVQIRGTNDNRVEINGVSTVGSGSSRVGISFEDVNPAIIAGVEVIKAPEASTIEGSVGGTVNLRTIRPLDLKETLASVRVQGEYSELSTEGIKPRLSGAFGNKWESTTGQEIGFVVSGSYTEQDAVSFRPRADVDQLRSVDGRDFLGIQFLLQEQENFKYETINFAGTVEAKPADNVKLYFDAIVNDQQRAQDSYRVQASGVSSLRSVAEIDTFESIDFGFPGTVGSAAVSGRIPVNLDVDDDDPNLRFAGDTGARVTVNNVFVLGGEWDITDRLSARAEWSNTTSETRNPNLSTVLNFINPNTPLDGGATGDPRTSNDNSVPFIFDRSNESLSFGIDFSSPFAPTPAQLLDPNNVVIDDVRVGRNTTDNSEESMRLDLSYDFEDSSFGNFLKSVDVGYRNNDRSTEFQRVEGRIGGFSRLEDSPNGRLFSELLVPGPDNYGDADGRELFVANFLLIDPDRAFNDPNGTLAILEDAFAQQRLLEPQADGRTTANIQAFPGSSYSVDESTDAFYAQANFNFGMVRGNVGARYIETDVDSTSFVPAPGGGGGLQTTSGSYDFFLPRANLVIEPTENVLIRAAYNQDILRPGFGSINTATTFTQNENTPITIGNPSLQPSVTDSFDISADWYFAPSSVFSIGYFNKKRNSTISQITDEAALSPGNSGSGLVRETNPDCPGGGIFNPIVEANQFAPTGTIGYCVDLVTRVNETAAITQEGIEVSFQHTLNDYEDRMGGFAWASGFGILANYTYQKFGGGSIVDETGGRGRTVLGDQSLPRGLLDNSRNAYNLTAFYEKYGLSARARYTWREQYRTLDFAGGASVNSTFSFPVVNESRGQLNASINYDITDNFNIGVEGVNLTKSNVVQRCVADTGPICFVGYPDRRIVFGGSYTF
jgi:TonB-dependent receptor